MNLPQESASNDSIRSLQDKERQTTIEGLFVELSPTLERVGWAICRDWGLAADAVQEAFMLLDERWETIEGEHRRPWLIKTVQLKARNLRRKEASARRLPSRLADQGVSSPGRGQPTWDHEDFAEVRAAVAELPESQRQVALMRLQGMGFAEIAESLNEPLGTVLSRMRLALAKLRKRLA